ncbi:hypothetical protein [Coleofasciculus sp. E2-BRE-01]|uniref:hypothetical protein n=1 Tax=Coleofasciculus sp. E2-BRE-01 TaxID=3069524 RepID=UPI003304B302
MDILKDERVNCYSVMTQLTINEYLDIIERIYESGGGIEGQRDPLKTSTAIRIRKRMIEDLQAGTVLPPIVLGVVVSEDIFYRLDNIEDKDFWKIIDNTSRKSISIIDGMQRTTALKEALKNSNEEQSLADKKIRIEYWIASNTNSLIYRMLVLNTGQVPWNLRRQLEIIFRSMIQEIQEKVPSIEILQINESKRRARPGQFQADQVIELFLVFGARKEKIDTKERLADEFTKQDFIEATADKKFTSMFYEILYYLGEFDKIFDKYRGSSEVKNRFQDGKDLFSSQPARVGFVTAIAIEVLGRPGRHYPPDKQKNKWNSIKKNADKLLATLENKNNHDIGEFLDLSTLNEVIVQKSGKVGDFEREFFLKSFRLLIDENFEIETMTPCWRAY